jgi:hypothetical protein
MARAGAVPVLLLLAATTLAQESTVDRDEVVEFFPTFGWRVEDGRAWECIVHGRVHERGHRRELLGLLIDRLSIGDQIDDATRATFTERALPFLVDNQRGQRLVVRVGQRRFPLDFSAPSGHFFGRIRVPASEVEPARSTSLAATTSQPAATTLRFQVVFRPGDARELAGEVELIGEQGISVVADIDDTLKISQVTDKRALLRNTFLRPYEAVPGMPEVFQAWAADGGVSFHYVSASPWQLYGPLAEFFRTAGYPRGTFHLKPFRWKDETLFDLFVSPEEYKPPMIEEILSRFPRRQFVLVGDSGEKDPEVYAGLARRHPEQIVRILIREVEARGRDSGRFQQVFDGLPGGLWQVFREAQELPPVLP